MLQSISSKQIFKYLRVFYDCLHFISCELPLFQYINARFHPVERSKYVKRERFWDELWLNSSLFKVLNIDICKPWMLQDLIYVSCCPDTLFWVLAQQLSDQVLELITIGNACFVR